MTNPSKKPISWNGLTKYFYAQTRTRTGDIQIFSLTLSQLSYLGKVGPTRFERMTSAMSRRRHNQLDHGPASRFPVFCSKIKPSVWLALRVKSVLQIQSDLVNKGRASVSLKP